MRILIPILGFGRAGGNRVLSQLANSWIEIGHEVDFLVPSTSEIPYFPTIAGKIWVDMFGAAVRSEYPPISKLSESGWRNILSLWSGLWKFGRDYDVVLANHSLTAWPVALSPLKLRRFYYIQAYEPEYYELEGKMINRILSKASYYFRMIKITNAPLYCNYKEIQTNYWCPPGLDTNIFLPLRKRMFLSDFSSFTIGCIGRKEPSKGTAYVLEAFEKLYKSDSRYRLVVAYGNLPAGYSHPGIEILEPKNDVELAEFYNSLDALVAAGTVQHGAAHYPVLEAMACGVPVVTTGYIPANSENAWIVSNQDSIAIAEAIEEIANGVSVTVKVERALKDISPYSWDAVASHMLSIFIENLPPDINSKRRSSN